MGEHLIKQSMPFRAKEALEYLESLSDPSYYNDLLEYIEDLQKEQEHLLDEIEAAEHYARAAEEDWENANDQIARLEEHVSELQEQLNG